MAYARQVWVKAKITAAEAYIADGEVSGTAATTSTGLAEVVTPRRCDLYCKKDEQTKSLTRWGPQSNERRVRVGLTGRLHVSVSHQGRETGGRDPLVGAGCSRDLVGRVGLKARDDVSGPGPRDVGPGWLFYFIFKSNLKF